MAYAVVAVWSRIDIQVLARALSYVRSTQSKTIKEEDAIAHVWL